jgi:hypothetical protein
MAGNRMNSDWVHSPDRTAPYGAGHFGLERIPRGALRFPWATFEPSLREDEDYEAAAAKVASLAGRRTESFPQTKIVRAIALHWLAK